MASPANFLAQFRIGSRISFLILLIFVSQILLINPSVFAGSVDHSVTVTSGNAAPIVSGVTLNNGSAITLTANATTSIRVNFTVTDTNDCTDVFVSGRVTTTVHRNGVSSTCKLAITTSTDLRSCYFVSTTTHNCVGGSSANATSVIDIYYFADATDASSSLASDSWGAFVQAQDAAGEVHSSTASAVELNTLLAVDVSTSTNYGSIAIGSDTSSTNQIATVKNAGNASTSLMINGIAMSLGGGGTTTIPTSSQHYATTTFTYGGVEQVLQETATAVSGLLLAPQILGPVWTDTTALSRATREHLSVVYKNFIYAIGGEYIGDVTSTVNFSSISATGTIQGWSNTAALPAGRDGAQGGVYGNYVYAIGGAGTGGSPVNTAYFATFNSTGSISNWTSTTSLVDDVFVHSVGVSPYGYVYVVGGITSSVLFAPINATGSLGSWSLTTPLPAIRSQHTSVYNSRYLYAIGGVDGGDIHTSSVVYAPFNSTGSLGAWLGATSLPNPLRYHSSAIFDNIIYVFSGQEVGGSVDTVYFSLIKGDGSLTSWQSATSIPDALTRSQAVINNGRVYMVAGRDVDDNSTSAVHFAQIPSRNTYWGLGFPATTTVGTYLGTNTFTAVFSP